MHVKLLTFGQGYTEFLFDCFFGSCEKTLAKVTVFLGS